MMMIKSTRTDETTTTTTTTMRKQHVVVVHAISTTTASTTTTTSTTRRCRLRNSMLSITWIVVVVVTMLQHSSNSSSSSSSCSSSYSYNFVSGFVVRTNNNKVNTLYRRRPKNAILTNDFVSTTGCSRRLDLKQYSFSSSSSTTAISAVKMEMDTNTNHNNATTTTTTSTVSTLLRPLCFYRSPMNNNKWKQRINIENLYIGQELQGIIVQEKLQNTTTGPKVWLDVGVCRWSPKGKVYIRSKKDMSSTLNGNNVTTSSDITPAVSVQPSYSNNNKKGGWKLCTALLRLGMNNYVKESVLKKKIARLRNKDTITVYVSRIYIQEGRFDVVLTPEELPSTGTTTSYDSGAIINDMVVPKILQSVTHLNVGDEVTGTVTKLVDYGVFVKLDGYNRNGLLHIRQVADLYNIYIDKQQGLIDAGLSIKSRIRLQVIEKGKKKRILLDFTNDVKQMAIEEQRLEQEAIEKQQNELRAQLQQQRQEQQSKSTVVSTTVVPGVVESNSNESIETSNIPLLMTSNSVVNLSVHAAPMEDMKSTTSEEMEDVVNNDDEIVDEDDNEEEEEYDNYDEEREIEDALGLGMY